MLDLVATSGEPFSQELLFKSVPSAALLNLDSHLLLAEIWAVDGSARLGAFTVRPLEATAGRFALELTAQEVDALPATSVWDLLVVEPGGSERIWLRGSVTVA